MAVLRYQAQAKINDSVNFALSDVSKELLTLLNNDLNTPGVVAYLSDIQPSCWRWA